MRVRVRECVCMQECGRACVRAGGRGKEALPHEVRTENYAEVVGIHLPDLPNAKIKISENEILLVPNIS